jgi:hypothetical protein
MSDRKIKKEADPIQGKAKIRPLTVLGASLRDRLHASSSKK